MKGNLNSRIPNEGFPMAQASNVPLKVIAILGTLLQILIPKQIESKSPGLAALLNNNYD